MNRKNGMFEIGEALYIQEGAISISEPADWGWHYQDNEGHNFVFSLKEEGFGWKATVVSENSGNNKVVLTDVEVESINGNPESVRCRVKFGSDSASHPISRNQSHRISLARYREDKRQYVHLERNTGYYPSWMVPLLGSTSSGKSCWLHALRTMRVAENLKRFVPHVVNVDPTQNTTMLKLKATQVGQERLVPVPIVDKKNMIKAMVYFVDLAGEIGDFEDRGNLQGNMQASIRSYASGLIVTRDINDLAGKPSVGNPVKLLLDMTASGGLPPRVCLVLTGADRIRSSEWLQKRLLYTKKSPVFEEVVSMPGDEKDNMYKHMAIASDLLNRGGVNPLGENAACFVVSSCTEQGDSLDFSDSKNVELPAAYMMEWLVNM